MSCDDQSIPGPLDKLPSPAPFKCPCGYMEDTIRESILVASGEMQKCMIQGKLDEWKSYEATINNCFLWLQESHRMGCDLCQVKTGCVILMFRCRKRGLDFLWEGVSSGRFGREFTAIFRDLYAEMKGIAIYIDVTINPVENGGACANMADQATGTKYSGKFLEPPLYLHGLNLIPAWLSNYVHDKVWDKITHPSPNFNGAAVEVWEWIRNFTPHFDGDVITFPCC